MQQIMSGNSNVNAVWTSEEGEQFEYMYRLFFFLFLSVKAVRFFLCKVEQWSIIKWVFGRILKAIIRKSAKQTKVCDAKLQGL